MFGRQSGAFISLVLVASLLAIGPVAAATDCDIVGTDGPDVLIGTDAAEVICGLGGNDIIRAGRGNDVVLAGGGDDVVLAGPGHDIVQGGPGRDRIKGQNGRDRLFGQGGADTINGGQGTDRIRGGGGVDSCTDPKGRTVTTGCEIDPDETDHERGLRLWAAHGASEFAYSVGAVRLCPEGQLCPDILFGSEVVVVRAGVATSSSGASELALTAEALFERAARATSGGGTADYEPVLGLPARIVDASGEGLIIDEVELRDALRQDVAAARALWERTEPSSYRFVFREICFCPGVGDVLVEVRDGTVVSAEPIGGGDQAWTPDAMPIDGHLDRIVDLLDGHHISVTAGFDPEFGFPVSYGSDTSRRIADEERTVEIRDFVDLTPRSGPVIVDVGGILVDESIAEPLASLLEAAAADGFDLGGGGYRDPARQVELRKVNCGTTEYAIWEMPAAQCSPPTAIPGRSMHEQGLAIDFTSNGRLIMTRADPAWLWLDANAARYGLFNHPGEPWHWSVNGN